jgi:ubiquinone/menaquinone biosynthesis C-methylase UbiE
MPAPPNPNHAALEQYRLRASVYDAELALFEPIRRTAVARLALRPGDVVLDVGCGTGLSLPLLRAAVGERGRIVGIEQCPEMLARARKRVAQQGWRNVTLVEAPVEDASIDETADAALFHFTHDILREPSAIANVARALRPGAHVVASGLQWSAPWLWPVNLFVLGAAMHSVSSLAGLSRPWSLLATRLDALCVETLVAGAVYVATGEMRTDPSKEERR